MVSVERREELESLLRNLGADERKWLQQNLLRRETAGLLCEATSLSEEELLTAENWFRRQFAEADCLRMRRSHARLWCLFMLLRYGGLRLVEALSLELRHMDWDSGSICLEGDRARRVPLPWAPCRRLRQLLEDPSLFPPSGRPLQCDASHVRRSLKQCGQACGLPAGLLTARSLRQARILELIRQGLPAPVADIFFAGRNSPQAGGIRYNAEVAQSLLCEHIQRATGPRTSARNVFQGRIEEIRVAGLMVRVSLCTAGGLRLAAVITDESFRSLRLAEGMLVTAIIKAPWIVFEPDPDQDEPHAVAMNCFRGTVSRVRQDGMFAEILVELADGSQACALHVCGERPVPAEGSAVWIIFKALSVILTL